MQQHLVQKQAVRLNLLALGNVCEHHTHRGPVFGPGSEREQVKPAAQRVSAACNAHRFAGQRHLAVGLNPVALQPRHGLTGQTAVGIQHPRLSFKTRVDRQIAEVHRVVMIVKHHFNDAKALVNRVEQRAVDFLRLIQLLFGVLAV